VVATDVILIHGLARTRFDMYLMRRRLRRLEPDWTIHIFQYQSRRQELEQIVAQFILFLNERSAGQTVSIVGHSLGGVIACEAARRRPSVQIQRIVTLGSPHGGAIIAKVLNRFRPTRWFFGPVLGELGTLVRREGAGDAQVGAVIGAMGLRCGFLPFFGEDNDGIVTVAEASFPICHAEKKVRILHGYMPFSCSITRQVGLFLKEGRFYD
jgi:pimeloyl-ACP methyl ester carboxylesterase